MLGSRRGSTVGRLTAPALIHHRPLRHVRARPLARVDDRDGVGYLGARGGRAGAGRHGDGYWAHRIGERPRRLTESRPELIFVEDDDDDASSEALPDFTIHVVNGSGEQLSSDDAARAAGTNLLVLNKTHLGPPLDPERDGPLRESLRIRGDAPHVTAQLRYGIGTIEIARQLLGSWRQTSAPAAWARPLDTRVSLIPANATAAV